MKLTYELGKAGWEDELKRAFQEQDKDVVTGWADEYGQTLLIVACRDKPSPSSASLLLGNDADPNIRDNWNKTALHHCGGWGTTAKHMAIARDLVNHGADLHAKDDCGGRTPLTVARINGHTEMVKLLEELAAAPPAAAQHA